MVGNSLYFKRLEKNIFSQISTLRWGSTAILVLYNSAGVAVAQLLFTDEQFKRPLRRDTLT